MKSAWLFVLFSFLPFWKPGRLFLTRKCWVDATLYVQSGRLPTQKMRQTSENTFSWPGCSNKNLFWDIPIRRSCIVFCTLSENCFLLSAKIGFWLPRNFAQGKKSALMIHDFPTSISHSYSSICLSGKMGSSTCLFLGKKSKLVPDSCLNNSSSGCSGIVAETPRALIWLQGKTIPTKTEPNLSLSPFSLSDYLSRILPKKKLLTMQGKMMMVVGSQTNQ